jgi:cytochrome P450
MRIVYRNPLELWGEPSYNEPFVSISTGIGGPLLIANDPALVRHVLVDNAGNYRMARVRQKILRPILKDGLLTAEGETWKRSRKAMAPVFTPRHIAGFARRMLERSEAFAAGYEDGMVRDIARDMTMLTYDILAETLFSGEIAGDPGDFAHQVDHLFETMGRVDPLDLIGAPDWLPRITRLRGRKALAFFRALVAETMRMRKEKLARDPEGSPNDFLTLLLKAEGPDGLSADEIEDNIITFIGAGHETTARALGWTLYCLSRARSTPWWRKRPIPINGWAKCRSPARPSRRRCGFIRRRRRSAARRFELSAGATSTSPPARRCRSCRGPSTATASCGRTPTPSSPRASIPRSGTRSTASSTCPSARARACASAPPSPCRRR